MAIQSATKELLTVPANNTKIPKCASSNNGVHWLSVKKSLKGIVEKNTTDSLTKIYTIASVVKTETAAALNKIASTILSVRLRAALIFASSARRASPVNRPLAAAV